MKVSIVGAGVVGESTGKGLHRYGHEVTFYDLNQQKLERLTQQGYRTTKNLGGVRDYDIHMICVPTLTLANDKPRLTSPDLTSLESALKKVAKTLNSQEGYQVVVIRSTLLPFTTKKMAIPLLQRYCRLILGEGYGICYNPEFLREDHALEDFLNPPIIVIGEADKRSGDILAELYAPFRAPQVRTTTENAEAIKCFSNAFNAMKISFFNQLYLIAKECNLDHEVISKALPKSTTAIRLPEYGVKGGYPFGGKCLPKDLAAVISFVKDQGLNPELFEAVAEINEEIRDI